MLSRYDLNYGVNDLAVHGSHVLRPCPERLERYV
jgi:hypothetical protein